MPNHVNNFLKIETENPEDVQRIYPLLSLPSFGFSFEALRPMPDDLRFIHKGSREIDGKRFTRWYEDPPRGLTDDDVQALREIYGAADWYEWSIRNWGTKWDAYDSLLEKGDGWIKVWFNTAWEPPGPWFDALVDRIRKLDIRADVSLVYSGEIEEPGVWTKTT